VLSRPVIPMKSLFVPTEEEMRFAQHQSPPVRHFDWALISLIGLGLVFLLIKITLKTALILLLVMLMVIICCGDRDLADVHNLQGDCLDIN
jgi:hypothetical protein